MIKTKDCWDSDLKIAADSKCPHCVDAEIEVEFPELLWRRVLRLTKEIDTEWLGYLKATKTKTKDGIRWKVSELIVPPQEASSAKVDLSETVDAPGVIHSHAGMAAFFSGTDDEYANANHEFSIVVNKAEVCKAVARVKLPCKALSMVEAKVFVEDAPTEADEWIEAAKKNVSKKVYQQPLLNINGGWNWHKDHGGGLCDDGPQTPVITKGPSRTESNYHYYNVTLTIPNLAAETQQEIASLTQMLNSGRLSKKKRKGTVRRLTELGALVERQSGTVTINLPGLQLGDFVIDGTMELGEKTAIGYYCSSCHSFANIKDLDKLVATNPKTNETECITCGGCLAPIIIDDIAKPEEKVPDEMLIAY